MSTFKMRWPDLGLEVRCEGLDVNKDALDILVANMPVKAVQGHEMVGGWILHDRSVMLNKKAFNLCPSTLTYEKMNKAPVGRISLLGPLGCNTEVMVKYDDCVDDRDYVPVAQVVAEDLEILKKAGKAQWKSATRTKEIIIVEFDA